MGWPLPARRLRRQLLLPAGAEPRRPRPRRRASTTASRRSTSTCSCSAEAHPLFRPYLEGGEMVEWGAKTIPEGGYYALPQRRHGDGVLLAGRRRGVRRRRVAQGHPLRDAVRHLRRARDLRRAQERRHVGGRPRRLRPRWWTQSAIVRDLRARRNMRLVFQKAGFYLGGIKAALMTVTGGAFPGGRIASERDAEVPRRPASRGALHAGRQAHVREGRRRLQGRQRDPRRHPVAPGRRRRDVRRRSPSSTSTCARPASTSGRATGSW